MIPETVKPIGRTGAAFMWSFAVLAVMAIYWLLGNDPGMRP